MLASGDELNDSVEFESKIKLDKEEDNDIRDQGKGGL
jgi:hypothetical protein